MLNQIVDKLSYRCIVMVKDEIISALKRFFDDLMEKETVDVKIIEWELDNIIYPHIGAYIASGELTKEEGREIFEFCERKLKELKEKFR